MIYIFEDHSEVDINSSENKYKKIGYIKMEY